MVMSERFFEDPILNSPYERPIRHWELDKDGIPLRQQSCRVIRTAHQGAHP